MLVVWKIVAGSGQRPLLGVRIILVTFVKTVERCIKNKKPAMWPAFLVAGSGQRPQKQQLLHFSEVF